MSAFAGTIQLALFALLGFALLTSLASALLYPRLRRCLSKHAPMLRARVLTFWATSPLILGVTLTLLCFLPSLFGEDHCTRHDDVHAHFCLKHPMSTLGFEGGWYLLLGLGLVAIGYLLWRLLALWSFSQKLSSLQRLSRFDQQRGVYVVDSASCIALSGGALHASIYLSSSLLALLPQRLLSAVIAHENAHIQRRDSLRKLAASWLSIPHLPTIREQLLRDLSLSCEQSCDEEASTQLGDRLLIAEAIVSVERLLQNRAIEHAALCAFIGGDINTRVESLLAEPLPHTRPSNLLLALLALSLFVIAEPMHHIAEDFWHLVLG